LAARAGYAQRPERAARAAKTRGDDDDKN
jgi:hypothetical protein